MSDTFRQPVTGARAWRSADFADESDWLTTIDAADVEALAEAAAVLPEDPHRWVDVDAGDVIVDSVADTISGLAHDLWRGRGFFWLRGLPTDEPELLRRLFWVIGNNLGVPTMQNKRGQVLSEVFDRFEGAERVVDTRGYESSDELTFHCDGGDSIGLACVRPAPVGGQNGLVSMAAIYNELLDAQPAHLDVLERGFGLYSRREASSDGTTAGGAVNNRRLPSFAWNTHADGEPHFSAWMNRRLAELNAEMSGTPFTDAEQAALDAVDEIAERPGMQLQATQQLGDVVWVNNLAVMHRRERYVDDDDPAQRRLLYRMWLNDREPAQVIAEHAMLRAGIRGPEPTIGAESAA
jgi:hypothetical protein